MKDISETHPSLMEVLKEANKVAWDKMSARQEYQEKLQMIREATQKHTVDKAVLRSIIEEVSAMEEHNSVYCDSFKAELLERLGLGDEE